MQNRNNLLEKIKKLKDIQQEKLDKRKDNDKIELHKQKLNGLDQIEIKLKNQQGDDVPQPVLLGIIAEAIKQYPRFHEGNSSSVIRKFLNEFAPGWDQSINTLSSSSSPTLYPSAPNIKAKIIPYKICVLGDAACGKTSIIKTLQKKPLSEEYKATVGTDFMRDQINGADCMVWDVAGNKKDGYMDTLLANPSAVILVFDITRDETLKNISAWNEMMGDGVVTRMLVANKMDLQTEQTNQLIEKAKEYAQMNGMQFAEVAANDPASVQAMFNRVINKLETGNKPEEPGVDSASSNESSSARRQENCSMM